MIYHFNNPRYGGAKRVPDADAKAAIAFANDAFPEGLVPAAIKLFEFCRLAEASKSLGANTFLLRNSARDLSCALALMPELAGGPDELKPLVEAVLADPIEREDGLVIRLIAPWLLTPGS